MGCRRRDGGSVGRAPHTMDGAGEEVVARGGLGGGRLGGHQFSVAGPHQCLLAKRLPPLDVHPVDPGDIGASGRRGDVASQSTRAMSLSRPSRVLSTYVLFG